MISEWCSVLFVDKNSKIQNVRNFNNVCFSASFILSGITVSHFLQKKDKAILRLFSLLPVHG